MRVETYSDRYFLDVVKLIENFHKEAVSEYDKTIEPNTIVETVKNADHSNAFLLIIEERCEGILFGARFRSPMSGKDIFQEVIWYVSTAFRRYGVKLLREVEKILKADGVSIMIMAVLENSKTEKLKRFYKKLGFKLMETHWVRNL